MKIKNECSKRFTLTYAPRPAVGFNEQLQVISTHSNVYEFGKNQIEFKIGLYLSDYSGYIILDLNFENKLTIFD